MEAPSKRLPAAASTASAGAAGPGDRVRRGSRYKTAIAAGGGAAPTRDRSSASHVFAVVKERHAMPRYTREAQPAPRQLPRCMVLGSAPPTQHALLARTHNPNPSTHTPCDPPCSQGAPHTPAGGESSVRQAGGITRPPARVSPHHLSPSRSCLAARPHTRRGGGL